MNNMIVEDVLEERDEPVQAVVVQGASRLERPPLPVVIAGFQQIMGDETVPVEDRAKEVAGYVRNLVMILDENMIILGYFLYHIRKESFWAHIPGDHHSFEQWCVIGSEGLDAVLVNTAIRRYLNWSDSIKFEVPDDIMLNQPHSVIKSEMIQRTIAEHHRDVKELTRQVRDEDERKQKIEEYTDLRREELIQIWTAKEGDLIVKKHEEDGAIRQEDLYITDLVWDDEQRTLTFTGSLSIDASERLLPDLTRVFHNALKTKFFIHAQRAREEEWKSLLKIADEQEQQMIGSVDALLVAQDTMSEEEIYEEWDEEDEDEM